MDDESPSKALEILLQLQQDIRCCRQCELRKRGGKPLVSNPVLDAKMFITGISPTVVAGNIDKPWTGDVGQKLTDWLSTTGLEIREVYFTNAIKCAIHDQFGAFCFPLSGPLLPWVKECRHWLLQEIHAVRPRAIVLLGVAPLYSVTGYDSIARFQREKQGQQCCGIPCFVLNHPSSDKRVGAWENSAPVMQASELIHSLLT